MTVNATAGGYRPDQRYDDPERLSEALTRRVLPLVSRPARYLGGEVGAARPPWRDDRANVLLAFPDAYEIGMSHTGMRALYAALGRDGRAYADLVFAPWPDAEERLRAEGLPLFGLQSRRPARRFDVLGFSLGYELGYANVLTMLDLAGLPLRAAERGEGDPLVIAGGACAANPAVLGAFIDVFFPGDGEEVVRDVAAAVRDGKAAGEGRAALLRRLAAVPGAWTAGAAGPVRPRRLADLDRFEPPAGPVPVIETVHDRLTLEVMRGCVRGCRFCQAGMIQRPVRERRPARIVAVAAAGVGTTGWDEVSLLSLSTSDYTGLGETVAGLRATLAAGRTNLVLPSLRADSSAASLLDEVSREEPGGLTFAPEAGSQRLRDVINKRITEEQILASARQAFAAGAKGVKLYFMIGLPTETEADLHAIVDLAGKIARAAPRGGSQVTVSISPFAPKPHTPFQWAGQIPRAEIRRRNELLERALRKLRVKVSLRDPEVSALEALLGLGDARTGEAVLRAWRLGARFDAWTERFDAGRWGRAFAETGIDTEAALAPRDPDAPLPWDSVAAIGRAFLRREWERALRGETTIDCRLDGVCDGCDCCEESGHALVGDWRDDAPRAGIPSSAAVTDGDAGAPSRAAADGAGRPPFDPRNASPDEPERERRRWSVWRGLAASRCWYRAGFTKLEEARFLGHLDFQRLLHLALRRSGLPVAHSQGFHPHPLLKFGPPLPLGVEGEAEVLDLALERQVPDWPRRLNAALPPGVRILDAVPIGANPLEAIESSVARFDYVAHLPAPADGGPAPAQVRERVAAFLAAPRWPFVRRRPKGDLELDVRPAVPAGGLQASAAAEGAGGGAVLRFTLQREAGAAGLSPLDLLAALCGDLLPEPRLCRVTRTGMRGRAGAGPWLTPLEGAGEANRRLWLRKRLCA